MPTILNCKGCIFLLRFMLEMTINLSNHASHSLINFDNLFRRMMYDFKFV